MTRELIGILCWYPAVVNTTAFVLYGIDKRRAVKDKWRIPEATLLGIAAAGGGVGALLGMRLWHHKTRKTRFRILVPFFTLLWIAGICLFWWWSGFEI